MPIEILEITPSPKPHKRFRIKIQEGEKIKQYDFGLDTGQTYIDHKDKAKRSAYWKRHYANKTEKRLIDNFIPSPALFSAFLLWGNSTSLKRNIKDLQEEFSLS